MSHWKFQLLGEFTAFSPDSRELLLPGRKHQALLAILLLSSTRLVSRDRLLELLWGSRSDEQARASLRGVLSEIRRACSSVGTCPIEANRLHVYISEDSSVDVDVDRIKNIAVDDSDALSAAVRLNGGELLASLKINERAYEQWKEIELEQMRRTYRKVLHSYLNVLQDMEQATEYEYTANRMLELDDADEDAHRALMQLYYSQGNRSLALRQFEDCQNRLHELYNSPVSQATADLANTIKANSSSDKQSNNRTINKTVKFDSTGVIDVALALIPFTLPSDSELVDEAGISLAQEIAGAASKFKWFRVVPTSETFRLNPQELSPSGITAATGAKYILYGRIAKSEKQYVLTVELIDGMNSATVWSERIQFSRQDTFSPEPIIEKIVGQLDVRLRSNEIAQAHRRTQATTGYECILLALSNMYELSKSSFQETDVLFQRAINHSPNYSWFYSFWSLWKMFCLGQQWEKNHKIGFNAAGSLARQAIKHDPGDALALVITGHFESFWEQNLVQGRKLVDQSITLNPYSSFAWMLSSATYAYSGEPEEALRRLEKSHSLCPVETHFMFMFDSAACIAHLFDRNPKKAEECGKQTVSDTPHFSNGYKQLLVALGHQRKTNECHHYLNRLLELEPDFNIQHFLKNYPFGKDEDRDYFEEGLKLAGVPPGKTNGKKHLSIVE